MKWTIILMIFLIGCTVTEPDTPVDLVEPEQPMSDTEDVEKPEKPEVETKPAEVGTIDTFLTKDVDICLEDGKPAVYMFSTTWCPHCKWAGPIFDKVVADYEGQIAAYHWEFDTFDNTLTENVEDAVPIKHNQLFETYNPNGGIPTFVFGCSYYRIGTGHEREGDKAAEEAEFRAVIEALLEETS